MAHAVDDVIDKVQAVVYCVLGSVELLAEELVVLVRLLLVIKEWSQVDLNLRDVPAVYADVEQRVAVAVA